MGLIKGQSRCIVVHILPSFQSHNASHLWHFAIWDTLIQCHPKVVAIQYPDTHLYLWLNMYAVHALIILPRSRFTPLKLMEEGRSERGTLKGPLTVSMKISPCTEKGTS